MGRQSTYSAERVAPVLAQIAAGKSVRSICEQDGMPSKDAIFEWLAKYPEFRTQYALAKELGAEAMAEDIFEIADDGRNDWMEKLAFHGGVPGWETNGENIQRSRLRVDARKWYLCHILPKKYGEKKAIEVDARVTTETSEARKLADLLTPEELATLQARMIAE